MTLVVRSTLAMALLVAIIPATPIDVVTAATDHLVISEVVTGGASASDELIEIYNPTTEALPLEGLELVYVTASGATTTRRAAWDAGAAALPPASHLLVAHELGLYAPIADVTYASGMSATGGSVALRIQGATSAVDAVGWGSVTSAWFEGTAVAAPAAGASVERLPGGAAGSGTDTDDNASDFVQRPVPDPQNLGSDPVPVPVPGATPPPTPSATPAPTTAVMAITVARALPDGSVATIEGDALTGSAFTDGGGYVADATGGIAVIVDGGAAFERGQRVHLRGTLDDRYAQRTLRVNASDLSVIGIGAGLPASVVSTGAIGESHEARLVRIEGRITGTVTALSGGLAYNVDDGSGVVRVVIGTETGIATDGWATGVGVAVVGVVGQRDSSGTGTAGYRVQPRDSADVTVGTAPAPSPSPSSAPGGPGPTPSPSPTADAVMTIAQARAAAKNTRLTLRGVVTLGSGVLNAETAVVQDATGAILVRLGDEAGGLALGELVEIAGTRSTKSGMESVRTSVAPRRLGSADQPEPRPIRTGDAAEALEAHLVIARGAVVASARKSSSGSVSLDIDDGSGPQRVVVGAGVGVDHASMAAGMWIEVQGVLGQETTGALPLRGYRIWPRSDADIRITASATDGPGGSTAGGGGTADGDGGGGTAGEALDALGRPDLAELRVGATLVVPEWVELGVAGLLWDGDRLVAVSPASAEHLRAVLGDRAVPVALELEGLREAGTIAPIGVPSVRIGEVTGQTTVRSGPIAVPLGRLPEAGSPAAWVSVVGRLHATGRRPALVVEEDRVPLDIRCERTPSAPRGGVVSVTGIALGAPTRLIVGCDGVHPTPTLALAFDARPGEGAAGAVPSAELAEVADASVVNRVPGLLMLMAAITLGAGALLSRRLLDDELAADSEPPET
ncbi:MAG: lamin tail domain-containing protein [Candidatus Limnocylindria bacterium]